MGLPFAPDGARQFLTARANEAQRRIVYSLSIVELPKNSSPTPGRADRDSVLLTLFGTVSSPRAQPRGGEQRLRD